MKPDRVMSMLSLAAKAGKVVSGGFSVEKAIQSGTACLCIIAVDASKNTSKKFTDSCKYYEIPCYTYGESGNLGHSIGKEFRMVLAVTDEGFARSIEEKLVSLNRESEVIG